MSPTLLLVLAGLFLPLQDPAKPPPAPAGAGQATLERLRELDSRFTALQRDFERAKGEWQKSMQAASADLERRRALEARHPVREYWERFRELDEQGHERSLLWLAAHAENRFATKAEIAAQKLALFQKLVDQHSSAPWADELLVSISLQRAWIETGDVTRLLEEFSNKTGNPEFAAAAISRVVSILSGVSARNTDKPRADELRERIRKDYPDTEAGRKLLGQPQAPERLAPGVRAPGFTAKDFAGNALALEEFRGRIVLLDFWGAWNPACRERLPALQALAQKHKQSPFVLVGVACDTELEPCRRLLENGVPALRNLWDGGRDGPLARQYQVQAFPTSYLLDAEGVIREVWRGSAPVPAIEEALSRLLAAPPPAPAPPKPLDKPAPRKPH